MKKPQKPVHRGTSGAAKGGGRKGGGKGGGRHRIGGGAGVVAGGGSAAPVKRKGAPGKGKGGGKKGSPSGAKVHVHHHHPKRKLAIGSAVACCSAEAVAASLRLAGWPVGDEDVLELYWRTASDPDEGASILATLRAAQKFGLAGIGTLRFAAADLASHPPPRIRYRGDGRWNRTTWKPGRGLWRHLTAPADSNGSPRLLANLQASVARSGDASLVIGVQLPGGPHALTLDPSGAVWSWGELYDPAEWPGAVIEEAWEVRW